MKILFEEANKNGISLSENQLEKFKIYMDFLIEYNSHTNLTAIKNPEDIMIKHFFDSIIIDKFLNIEKNNKVIDIGTGAGFPGVPMKILRKNIDLTLLDSLNKRIVFLDKLSEKIGVTKSLDAMKNADLVIVVLNSNEKLAKEDKEILEQSANKTRIIVLNKNDLPKQIDLPANIENVIETNTNSSAGIATLKDKIKEMFNLGEISNKDYTYLSNARQISLAKKAYKNMEDASNALKEDMPVDLIAIDLKECFDTLGEIIGVTYSDEIIDNLFENFCVGK